MELNDNLEKLIQHYGQVCKKLKTIKRENHANEIHSQQEFKDFLERNGFKSWSNKGMLTELSDIIWESDYPKEINAKFVKKEEYEKLSALPKEFIINNNRRTKQELMNDLYEQLKKSGVNNYEAINMYNMIII